MDLSTASRKCSHNSLKLQLGGAWVVGCTTQPGPILQETNPWQGPPPTVFYVPTQTHEGLSFAV